MSTLGAWRSRPSRSKTRMCDSKKRPGPLGNSPLGADKSRADNERCSRDKSMSGVKIGGLIESEPRQNWGLIVKDGLRSSSRAKTGEARFRFCELRIRASSWELMREPPTEDETAADLDREGARDAPEPLVDIWATVRAWPWDSI